MNSSPSDVRVRNVSSCPQKIPKTAPGFNRGGKGAERRYVLGAEKAEILRVKIIAKAWENLHYYV